ncbi:MAG: hypothetical protein KJN87_07730, partial [Desulfofustis sp.]|nr:hypothetical protein [Desulfofustis sp.]
MVEPLPAVNQLFKNTEEILLSNDECIVVASTSEQISAELQDLLTEFDLPFTVASTIDQIIGQLNNHRTALALLDLSLVKDSSTSIMNRVHRDQRELGIIVVDPSSEFGPFVGREVDRYLAGPLNGAA